MTEKPQTAEDWNREQGIPHYKVLDVNKLPQEVGKLIKQARQEGAQEIFRAYDAYIESLGADLNELTQLIIKHEKEHKASIQALKQKYGGSQ